MYEYRPVQDPVNVLIHIGSWSHTVFFTILPGTPTTVQFGGTSSNTTEPAPILEFSPTVNDPNSFAPALTITLSHKVG